MMDGQELSKSLRPYLREIYFQGVKPCIKFEKQRAYSIDPINSLSRNRVNAEIAKTLMRLDSSGIIKEQKTARLLLEHLSGKQNNDGSYNEIHPNYDNPSALETSFVGEAFLLAEDGYRVQLDKCVNYVKSKELKNGYFLKSEKYTADHLNVDATCGAFLAKFGKTSGDSSCIKAAQRAGNRVISYQFKDGSYPYTSNKGSYPHHLKIPCIHYQGVTLYYLMKMNEVLKDKKIERSIEKGVRWLARLIDTEGRWDWSKSGMLFALFVSGSYGFGLYCFTRKNRYKEAELALRSLKRNTRKILDRWDCISKWEAITRFIYPHEIMKIGMIGDYPISHRLTRFGYVKYKEIARARFSDRYKDGLFKAMVKVTGSKVSTVEPSANYPDLFMTTEMLDCLSSI